MHAKTSDDIKAGDHTGRGKRKRARLGLLEGERDRNGEERLECGIVWTNRTWEESSKVQSAKMKGSCGS